MQRRWRTRLHCGAGRWCLPADDVIVMPWVLTTTSNTAVTSIYIISQQLSIKHTLQQWQIRVTCTKCYFPHPLHWPHTACDKLCIGCVHMIWRVDQLPSFHCFQSTFTFHILHSTIPHFTHSLHTQCLAPHLPQDFLCEWNFSLHIFHLPTRSTWHIGHSARSMSAALQHL